MSHPKYPKTEKRLRELNPKGATFISFNGYDNLVDDTSHLKQGKPPQEWLLHCLAGLAEETGEVLGVVKRLIRDKGLSLDNLDEDSQEKMLKELGDVLWYVSALAQALDSDLQEVALLNCEKLQDRKERNMIQGSGDDR
jgi:NTP pyrophosphatase (non-canonical NTP hydrolase)